MQQFTARVSDHQLIADSFRYLHLELVNPGRIEFRAGQYLILTVDGAKGIRRNYSIASQPQMNHAIELLVDVKPQGPGSEYLKNLKPGDKVEFVAPFGNFVVADECLKRSDPNQLLFAATGSGISPVRSMISDLLLTKKHQGPIRLWWGMRRQEDCFWIEDFDNLEREYPNFKWDLVLSQPPENWPLHSGHVTDHVLNYVQYGMTNDELRMKNVTHAPESHGCKPVDEWLSARGSAPPNPVRREAAAVKPWSFTNTHSTFSIQNSVFCFYLCGNRFMIEELSTKLAEAGINTEHIHTEKFF